MPSSKGNADQTSHGTWTLGICSRFFFCIHQHCKLPKNTFFCQEWHHHKDEDILTYRDKSFASKFTGDEYLTPFLQLLFSYNSSLTTSLLTTPLPFQAPSPQSTTPTSCMPSTTPSTPSCTRQRSEKANKLEGKQNIWKQFNARPRDEILKEF